MTDAKITLTAKAGTSFDSPWIVVHADTVDEGKLLLAEIAGKGLDTDLANAGKHLQAVYAVASGGLAPQQVSPQPAAYSAQISAAVAPQQAAAAPWDQPVQSAPTEAKACIHGPMTYRTGTNARGAWTGYFCPTPKGTPNQCSPEFVR